jgi:hypothetical protein
MSLAIAMPCYIVMCSQYISDGLGLLGMPEIDMPKTVNNFFQPPLPLRAAHSFAALKFHQNLNHKWSEGLTQA